MKRELTRKELEALYLPPTDDFVTVDVPEMNFFMLDGEGSPGGERFRAAIRWLFAAVHPIKQEGRRRMGRSFVEPPLEGLFWAEDTADLAAARKDRLKWRLMIPGPGWATEAMLADAVARAEEKLGAAPPSLRLESYREGECVQIQFVGDYAKEAARIARRLHEEFLPAHGLIARGPHHEIYLTDPSRTAPERNRTVVRQPVCRA